MIRFWLLALISLGVVSCDQSQVPSETPLATAIDSFGANPNPSPLNVGVQFSWTVLGQDLVCQLDAEGDGTVDYVVQGCTSQSRVVHNYGVRGTYTARLTVSGADGKTLQQTTPVVVASPNNAPVIPVLTPSTPAASTNPLEVRFDWTVSDPDSDVTRCRFDAESDGVWEFDNLCSGLPAYSSVGKAASTSFAYTHKYGKQGTYEATLEAADLHISTRARVKVRVPYNRSPLISIFKASPGDNNSATIEFAVTDPDEDTLECVLMVEGVGKFRIPNCTKATRRYSFSAEGSYMVTLAVTDPFGGRTSNSRVVNFGSNEKIIAIPAMTSGSYYSCFLSPVGKMYCWGYNEYGELGLGDDSVGTTVATPQAVLTDLRFKSASGGAYHTCALTEKGEAYCWGLNDYGELGLGDGLFESKTTPYKVATEVLFKQIATGEEFTCAISVDDDLYCWGYGGYGQLGVGDFDDYNDTPQLVGGRKYTQVTTAYYHACALARDTRKTYCWGYDDVGELGTGVSGAGYLDSPQEATALTDLSLVLKKVVAGYYFSCGLTDAGDVYCWGWNRAGQLGTGKLAGDPDIVDEPDYTDSAIPSKVATNEKFIDLETGPYSEHVCGIKAGGETWCWGWNANGNLGAGFFTGTGNSEDDVDNDVRVGVPTVHKVLNHKFTFIATAGFHTCGYTVDAQLMCWGMGTFGQMGNGETVLNNLVPTLVGPLP